MAQRVYRWRAFDGKLFENEADALEYEVEMRNKLALEKLVYEKKWELDDRQSFVEFIWNNRQEIGNLLKRTEE